MMRYSELKGYSVINRVNHYRPSRQAVKNVEKAINADPVFFYQSELGAKYIKAQSKPKPKSP